MQPPTAREPSRLFLFSPDEADILGAQATDAGFLVTCAALSVFDGALIEASDVAVAVVDARGQPAEARAIVAAFSERAVGRGLLVLVTRADVGALGQLYDAGATHFLTSPWTNQEFAAALRFAARHSERAGAGVYGAVDRLRRESDGLGEPGNVQTWINARLTAGETQVGVMQIALTRFDIVNAAYGRAAGDQILRLAERRIADIARELGVAIVARTEGSEFVLATMASPERLALAAARLSRALSLPFIVGDTPARLGSRIGTADAQAGDDAAALLRRAGEALAEAKASDGAVQSAGMAGVAPIDQLAVDLHRAIERDELEMLFQPQVDMATGAIVGVEALARWEHPTLGALGAELLFAAAERADLGAALSDHVQALALTRAVAWPEVLGSLRLSINITATDLARADFAARFLSRVAKSGFPLTRLTAEVTETGLIAELDQAAGLLAVLRSVGCRVAIDDFGTGYSSLAYLKALPLDYLKIDKALVQDITGSARDRVVVRGVIEIAHALGLKVIAEGVETREQRDLLAADGCELYQGFLCAEALDVRALAQLVQENGAKRS